MKSAIASALRKKMMFAITNGNPAEAKRIQALIIELA